MNLKVFSIYDSKAEAYLPPFHMKSNGEAIRAVTDLVNDAKHNFSKYAQDYTLFAVGTWDDATCKYDLYSTPMSLGVFLEFKTAVVS